MAKNNKQAPVKTLPEAELKIETYKLSHEEDIEELMYKTYEKQLRNPTPITLLHCILAELMLIRMGRK